MRSAKTIRWCVPLAALATGVLAFLPPAPATPAITAPTAVVAPATPAPPTGTTVACVGTRCGGNGGPVSRMWSYVVTPGSEDVVRVDIGVHFRFQYFGSLVHPPGWSVQVLPDSINDDTPFTPHGSLTPQNGSGCTYVMRWTGPRQTAPFQLGYNSHFSTANTPHEVEWDTSSSMGPPPFGNVDVADWTKPVGLGQGPVHSPRSGLVPVDAEEEAQVDCSHDEHAEVTVGSTVEGP